MDDNESQSLAADEQASAPEPTAEPQPPATESLGVEQLGLEPVPPEQETARARFLGLIEAVVYIAEEPLPAALIAQALGETKERVEEALAELIARYEQPASGIQIRQVAGGYKLGTKPEFHDELRFFIKKLKPPLKLSLAALETLAVIAYKQPITAPEIMEIRGVQGAGVLKTLLERKLITAAGRKQVVGRPVLYKTTKDFLVQFGLKDVHELPSLKEFEEWSRFAVSDAEEAVGGGDADAATSAQPDSAGNGETGQPATEING